MAWTHFLLRYGELFLKGKNQQLFERQLVSNIQQQTGLSSIKRLRGRLIVPYFELWQSLSCVFGLSSYSPAIRVDQDIGQIQQAVLGLLPGALETFVLETKRADKRFPHTSPQVNAVVGKYIEETTPLLFSRESQNRIYIEINSEGAYVFTEYVSGAGGLPVGVEGRVLLLLEDSASALAGILMMKRGCAILPVSFQGQKDISLLQKFSPFPLECLTVSLSEFEVGNTVKEIVRKYKAQAFVVGQTLDTFQEISISLPVDVHGTLKSKSLPVLRPLIGYTLSQITVELEKYKGLVIA